MTTFLVHVDNVGARLDSKLGPVRLLLQKLLRTVTASCKD